MEHYQNRPVRTLEEYWAIGWRRRWWLIVPLFFGWGLVTMAGRFMSPRYRSETVIIIGQQRVSEQYMLPNIALDVQARLQNITQQILSRTRLLGLIDHLHLYEQDQKPTDPDALVERMRRDIKIDLIPAPGRQGELSAFRVSYSAPSAALAQQVTNELTSFFINENLRNQRQTSENTTQFLEEELETARLNLARQDDRLRDFKARHLGELPEQLQNNIQILSGLQTRLQANTDALDEANQQKLYLESLLSQYRGVGVRESQSGGPQMDAASVDDQIMRLQAELDDLSVRYKPNHPDVRRLQDKIASLRHLKDLDDAKQQSSRGQGTRDGSQAAQSSANRHASGPALQIESQLGANKLKIAHLEQTAQKLDRQIEEYQNRLNVVPLREQESAEINRDHEQARAQYESLLSKKTQSEMASNLEKQRQGELFSVIDPPNLPQRPYWPDRFKFNLLGMVIGAFFGLGATFVAEMLDVRIHRDEDLRDLLALPVLAGIPMLQTADEQRRQQLRQRLEAIAASVLATFIPTLTLLAYVRG